MNNSTLHQPQNPQARWAFDIKRKSHLIRSGTEVISRHPQSWDDDERNIPLLESFCNSHAATTLEISTCFVEHPSLVRVGKIVPSNVRGFFGLAIRVSNTPDAIESLRAFRLTPSRICRRGKIVEAYWNFVIHHLADEGVATEQRLPFTSYAEYQTVRRNLGAELGVSAADDGLWMILPAPGEEVFTSGIPYDFSELAPKHVIDPAKEAFVKLADAGILPGVESAKHPDRAYSHTIYFYLRSFPGLSLLTDKALTMLCRDYGATLWRSAALHGLRFPPLKLFRNSLEIRYPDVRWTNDRSEWSTN